MANVSFRWDGRLHTLQFKKGDLTRFMHIRGVVIPVRLGRIEAQVLEGNKHKLKPAEGWRPEQAREVLPNSTKTEIVVTANAREWRHIFKLRAIGVTGAPHPEMARIMVPLLEELKTGDAAALFEDLTVKK